jgi:plasmid stabilization system protein ParE
MKYRIILSPDARADINSAVRWYQQIDPDVAFRFLLKTGATIDRIRRYPYSFQRVKGVFRRAVLHRFPYSIFFVLKNELAIIMAVRHQRQSGILQLPRQTGTAE